MFALTESDIEHFIKEGFVLIPGAVPESLLTTADQEIDVVSQAVEPTEGDGGPGVNAWFLPPQQLPACDAVLRESPVLALARQLVAPNEIELAFDHIQISTTSPPWSHLPGGPHIDGHGPGQNPPHSFTLLAGVLLTEQMDDQSGNLWVWPRSHLAHAALFRERGVGVLTETGGHATLLDPAPPLEPPLPVRGHRGDILLAHYLLGHNKGGNTQPFQRRTLYYRLAVRDHRRRWSETFLNAWAEFPRQAPPVSEWGRRTFGDPCRQCGFSWASAFDDCHDAIHVGVESLHRLVRAGAGAAVPELGWTSVGYVAHVGDSLRVWAERIASAVLGASPVVAPYDQDALADARHYNELDGAGVLWSLDRSLSDWDAAVLLARDADQFVMQHEELGSMDLLEVARIRAHDVSHHVADVQGIVGRSSATSE